MQTCDVFCKIVDNYGDIGVCWRLSKQLAHEHGLAVRLFIDDFETASRIIPTLLPTANSQTVDQVNVTPWPESAHPLPDLVIENFSCGVPDSYAKQVAKAQADGNHIQWINLEYLSAEAWVEGCHLMPSEHPQLGVKKTFYYPGFSAKAGGLLREIGLQERQQAWKTDAEFDLFWQSLGLNPVTLQSSIRLSLFCYPQADSLGLIKALQDYHQAITLLIPSDSNSDIAQKLDSTFAFDKAGLCKLGNLSLQKLPFMSQDQYDQLLAACHLNFVRGEDSWIRALWSGKPFIWQPYIQTEDTHLVKLKAFLQQYLQHTDTDIETKALIQNAHLLWSNAVPKDQHSNLATIIAHLTHWQTASQQASQYYHHQASLTEQLMQWLAKST